MYLLVSFIARLIVAGILRNTKGDQYKQVQEECYKEKQIIALGTAGKWIRLKSRVLAI